MSWGGWLSKVATTVAKSVQEAQQFGQECLDSVVAIDEDDSATTAANNTTAASPPTTLSDRSAAATTAAGENVGATAVVADAMPPSSSSAGTSVASATSRFTQFLFSLDDNETSSTQPAKATAKPPSEPQQDNDGWDVDIDDDEKAETATAPPAIAPQTVPRVAAANGGSAAPPPRNELAFLAAQPLQLFSFGKQLVERGADAALRLLPDLDEKPSSPTVTATPAEPPASSHGDVSAAPTDSIEPKSPPSAVATDPLELLRQRRGYVLLNRRRRQPVPAAADRGGIADDDGNVEESAKPLANNVSDEGALKELEAAIEAVLQPSSVSMVDYSVSCDEWLPDLRRRFEGTRVAKRLAFVRDELCNGQHRYKGVAAGGAADRPSATATSAEELLKEQALVDALSTFPDVAREGASAIADILLNELAEVVPYASEMDAATLLAEPAESVTEKEVKQQETDWKSDHDWFDSPGQAEETSADIKAKSSLQCNPQALLGLKRAQAIRDLVALSQCECARGSAVLANLAGEALSWARRSSHPNVKDIKDQVLQVKGDILVARAGDITRIEEALECCVVLLAQGYFVPRAVIKGPDAAADSHPTETPVADQTAAERTTPPAPPSGGAAATADATSPKSAAAAMAPPPLPPTAAMAPIGEDGGDAATVVVAHRGAPSAAMHPAKDAAVGSTLDDSEQADPPVTAGATSAKGGGAGKKKGKGGRR